MTTARGGEFDHVPVILRFNEVAQYRETYGFSGSGGNIVLEGQRLVPRRERSAPARGTVFCLMHPVSALHLLPFPQALAEAGLHVLCCASRYPRNDSALVMEKVLLDLGHYVRYAREELGYEKVVLVGWSGGGALSIYYQSQAQAPTVTATPAGDPLDLRRAGLVPADALILTAAHRSRAKILSEWLDPSMLDEADPAARTAEFDLYDPGNPNQPPYSAGYVAEFRSRQVARNRRISAWVREVLAELERRDSGEVERGFVVHRTMAEPRWLDPALDPNDRKPGWCYLGDPRAVNNGPTGLARFCTLRSWLSQWSFDDSRADAETEGARVTVPALLIENSADDAVPATHMPAIHAALGSADKTYRRIEGATHYYAGQPEKLAEALGAVLEWAGARGLA